MGPKSTNWEKLGIEPATPGFKAYAYPLQLRPDVPSALSLGRLLQQLTSQISETFMRYAK